MEESSSCSCENRLNEDRTHNHSVDKRMEQKCSARQVEVLLVEVVAGNRVNFSVSRVVNEVELCWGCHNSKISCLSRE